MTKSFQNEKPLRAALRAVPGTRALLARELHAMAGAAGDDYRQFAYVAPWIRNIWRAAAEELEGGA